MLDVILVVSEKMLSEYVESASASDSDSGMKSKTPAYSEKWAVDCERFGGGWLAVGEEDVVGSIVVVALVVAAVGVEEDIIVMRTPLCNCNSNGL